MKNIRLCEIYDERHIMLFDDYSFSFEEVLDDLSLKSLFSSTGFTDLIQILKYDDKTFLLISLDHFNYCSFENNFDDFNPLSYVYTKDYNFIKADYQKLIETAKEINKKQRAFLLNLMVWLYL